MYRASTQVNHYAVLIAFIANAPEGILTRQTNLLIAKETNNEQKKNSPTPFIHRLQHFQTSLRYWLNSIKHLKFALKYFKAH